MNASQTREATIRGLNAIRQIVEREGDPDDLSTIDRRGLFDPDLMVGNYGDPGVRTALGELRLTALYPPVISGDVESQIISAITVAGTLHITHVSRHPFPSLMKDAWTILRDASSPKGLCGRVAPRSFTSRLSRNGT